jgi:hypothetical protein
MSRADRKRTVACLPMKIRKGGGLGLRPFLTNPFLIPAENATQSYSWNVDRASVHDPQCPPQLAPGYPGFCKYRPSTHANGLSHVFLSERESDSWWRIRCADKAGPTIGALVHPGLSCATLSGYRVWAFLSPRVRRRDPGLCCMTLSGSKASGQVRGDIARSRRGRIDVARPLGLIHPLVFWVFFCGLNGVVQRKRVWIRPSTFDR